jgi:hypothetical protein
MLTPTPFSAVAGELGSVGRTNACSATRVQVQRGRA